MSDHFPSVFSLPATLRRMTSNLLFVTQINMAESSLIWHTELTLSKTALLQPLVVEHKFAQAVIEAIFLIILLLAPCKSVL